MVPDGDRWTLPFHETQEHHNWQGVRDEHRLLKEALGMDVFTLRLIWVDYDEDKRPSSASPTLEQTARPHCSRRLALYGWTLQTYLVQI